MNARLPVIGLFVSAALWPQQPLPYSQLDPKPYDPKVDADMQMFMGDWRNSHPRKEHGGLVIRDLFTRREGDLLRPARKGAVLAQFSEFAHGTLYPRTSTLTGRLEGEQKVFYVYSGRGVLRAGGKTAELRDGVAVLVPTGVEFSLENPFDESLRMYVVAEPVPPGFQPRPDILVRDENTIPITSTTGHWVNIDRMLFRKADGFALLQGMATVYLDPMTMAQPHASTPLGTDVLWIAVRGEIHSLLGKRLFRMAPGTCFKNPGDGRTYHGNINTSDEPVKLLWTRAVPYKEQ